MGHPALLQIPGNVPSVPEFQGDNTRVEHTTTLTVNFIWFTLARTGEADVTGVPAMAGDAQGVWHITGIGNMVRVLPIPNVLVTPTSQFFNKVLQHEQVHVNQWQPGGLVGDLYIPADLLSQVSGFTGTSQIDLTNKYNTALQNYRAAEDVIFGMRNKQLEHQAYLTSDPIPPQFMVQNCDRF
jgi:hypothetical protein